MDDYEFSEVKEPRRRNKPAGLVWNALTIIVLIGTLLIAVAFFFIYLNPFSRLNPFPPPITDPHSVIASPTRPPRFTLMPTWTPTNANIQATETPAPTVGSMDTTNEVDNPPIIQSTAPAVSDDYAFVLQDGSPAAIDAVQFHPDGGCNWAGVAGQATSLNGEAVRGLFVQLGGSLPGVDSVDYLTMTGMAPQYGQGGFEMTLSDQVIASKGTLWIQLLDQQNLPLSDRIYFDTYNECTKNLVIIYFDQIR